MTEYRHKNTSDNVLDVIGIGLVEAGQEIQVQEVIENPNLTGCLTKVKSSTRNLVMANEINGNSGHLALKREVDEGVVNGTPDIFVPFYSERMTTELNPATENSIFGNTFARLMVTPASVATRVS